MINDLVQILNNIKKLNPLVHHITNYVTVNDCANVTLAIKASPIMADEIKEIKDIVSISSSLLLNIGTINKLKLKSMLKASKYANKNGIPTVLDPVGAGASKFRKKCTQKILKEAKISCIKGNLSEIKSLIDIKSYTKGVDSSKKDFEDIENSINIAKMASKKLNTIIAITDKIDVIAEKDRVVLIKNGSHLLPQITGTGCMCASLIASCCATNKEKLFEATILGLLIMSIAGEIAFEKSNNEGLGSFHKELFNAIDKFNENTLKQKAKLEIIK